MMAKKIDVKLLLELRQANMSQRAIASTRHISTKSVAAVWRRADELGISLADVTDKTSDEVYTLFFPEKFRKETMYAAVDYEYVQITLTQHHLQGVLRPASRRKKSSVTEQKAT